MSYLERLQAKAAMSARSAPAKGSEAPSNPFAGDLTGHCGDLPKELVVGLQRLSTMRPPRLLRPEYWPIAVGDAFALIEHGWAHKALALGWSRLDLFGAVTDRDGQADADGLAVWVEGRRVLAMCETHAFVSHKSGRACFNRCNRLATTLLWDIGR